MTDLPASPDLDHLRKQAKRLLRAARHREADALARFGNTLPAARRLSPAMLAAHPFRLHDAQSVVAREHGFPSWPELKRYVDWRRGAHESRLATWLALVFADSQRWTELALRMLRDEPSLTAGDPWLACVVGDTERVRRAIAADPGFAGRAGGPQAMPPLVAVTHSRLIGSPECEGGLLATAELLLAHGADPDARWTDPRFPEHPLSALYGAAGRNHHAAMIRLLLSAGADPNDGESLYHSVEAPDDACTRLLLEAGARGEGSNAIGRARDFDRPATLALLLAQDSVHDATNWLGHAIRRGRSLTHIVALIESGADLRAIDRGGFSGYRRAAVHGRTDIVAELEGRGIVEALSPQESFVAAAARGDNATARAMLARDETMLAELPAALLRVMPQLAATGRHEAVRAMLALGWPREVTAEWEATALNLAVFAGDAEMAALLLSAGADWTTRHGYGDTVLGTLSFASQATGIGDPAPRDYAGCALALAEHGIPRAAFGGYSYPVEVSEALEAYFAEV